MPSTTKDKTPQPPSTQKQNRISRTRAKSTDEQINTTKKSTSQSSSIHLFDQSKPNNELFDDAEHNSKITIKRYHSIRASTQRHKPKTTALQLAYNRINNQLNELDAITGMKGDKSATSDLLSKMYIETSKHGPDLDDDDILDGLTLDEAIADIKGKQLQEA